MGTQAINFDDLGAKPVQTGKPGAIDFADLGARDVSTPPGAHDTSTLHRSILEDVAQGFGASAAETLITAGKLGSYIPGTRWAAERIGDIAGLPKLSPGTNPYEVAERGTEKARAAAKASAGGAIGAGLEGVAEWVNGEEALKGLSVAERLGIATKIAKLAESHPAVAKLITMGLNAVRTGTLGTVQGLAHGETAGEALETGATAAGTGAVLEGAAEGVKAVAPKVKKIAGALIPVRASEESKLAIAAEHVAPSKTLQKFGIEQTQPAAKRAIGNIATDVTKFPAKDLEEAAKQVRTTAKPVYQKLDVLTKDREGGTFSDWQRAERQGYRQRNFDAVKKAQDEQQKIIAEAKGKIAPDDLTKADAAWKQGSALEKVHDALNTKAVLQPTPVAFRLRGAPDPGIINGKNFSRTILKLRDDGTLKQAGLTPEHIQDLQDLGSILENAANTRKLSKLVTGGGAFAEAIGLATHPAIAAKAAAAAVPAYAMSRLLGKVMTDPNAARLVVKALRAGQRIAPAITAQAARAAFDGAKASLSGQQ